MIVPKMTDDLFALRRKVIELLYEARAVIGKPLPRLKIRIVDYTDENNEGRKVLGRCFIGKDYITISSECGQWSEDQLRKTVWHELGHAFYKAKHDHNCPLMRQGWKPLASKQELSEVLKKLAANS